MGYKDRAKVRAKALAQGDRFKLKDGENFVRVLPTPESVEGAEDDVVYEVLMHNDVGKDKRFVRCGHEPHDITEGECYICDVVIPRLIANNNHETAKKLKPKWQGVMQVLALDGDSKATGPHFWMVGGKLGQNILMLLGQSNRDYASIKKGYWIFVNRTGSGLNTEYSAPIPDEESTAVAEKYGTMLKPFNQLTELPMYSEQLQKDAWLGTTEEAGGSGRQGSPSSRRSGVMDEDEAPAPTSRRRAPVVVDDDAEDAPPVRAKAKVKQPEPEAEADEPEEVPVGPSKADIIASPKLKARDPLTGDYRYKVEVGDGKFVAMTADGRKSPKGMEEDAVPIKPGKLWLQEHPEPQREVEEEAEIEVDEPEEAEEAPAPTRGKGKGASTSKPAVEPEDDDLPPTTSKAKGKSKQASLPLEDEDTPPAKTTGKAKAAAVVLSDDEDPFGED